MQVKYVTALVTLLAGAITCIICLYKKLGVVDSLERLLIVLVIFYIIGSLAKKILSKALLDDKKELINNMEEKVVTEDDTAENGDKL